MQPQNFYTLFNPDSDVKATLLILHGMQEHSGRYEIFAEYLSRQGFAIITYDHAGHGYTAKNEEDLGFFQNDNPAQKLIDDALTMADYLQNLYPSVPHFIMGHSMGSFITRCVLQEASTRFDATILMGTGGRIPGLSFAREVLKIFNRISPHYRSTFINSTFVSKNNLRFRKEEPREGVNWLSVNIENRKKFLQDPLCGVPFSINGFYTLFTIVTQATEMNWAKNIRKDFPMLLISGADDVIGDFGKGVTKTFENLQKQEFQNITLKLYPTLRHEILNESKPEVYENIVKWLNSLITA